MINPAAEKRLQLLFPNSNRALAEAFRQATPEQLALMQEAKGVKELLASLTGEALRNAKSDTLLLEILRNSPAFRELGSFTDTLETLLQHLGKEQKFSVLQAKLQAFLKFAAASPEALRRQLTDSGIFLESKLLASAGGDRSVPLSGDVKALLLQLQQELHRTSAPGAAETLKLTERLLMQIDYHQLYSHLSNAAVLYFPYAWDLLEEGTLAFKKAEDRTFYCRIELTLKTFGALHLLVALSGEKQVMIRARTEQEALMQRLREQLPVLRGALRQAGLDVQGIEIGRFAPPAKNSGAYGGENGDTDLGFEVKI
jgi:hypothetical protein